MAGEDFGCFKHAINQAACANHTFALAKQIWQNTRVRHRDGGRAIGDVEGDGRPLAAAQCPLLHKAADAEGFIRCGRVFGHLGGRHEEIDAITKPIPNQRGHADQAKHGQHNNLNTASFFQCLHRLTPIIPSRRHARSWEKREVF